MDKQLNRCVLFVSAAVVAIWLFYIFWGPQAVEWLYNNRENIALGKIIDFMGDRNQPMARYLAKAERLIFEFLWIMPLVVIGTYVVLNRIKSPRPVFGILIFAMVGVKLMEFIAPSALTPAAYTLIPLWLSVLLLISFLRVKSKKRLIFECFIGVTIIIFVFAIFEFFIFSISIVPAFPKYLTHPSRWGWPAVNSMGFLDKERSFENKAGLPRVLFIGDSMLEISGFSIVPGCEKAVEARINKAAEFINLGESDTDPVDYYWRLRSVGMRFKPDALLIFITEVNDFIGRQRFSRGMKVYNFISIYPQQSIFSRFFPRTASLLSVPYYRIRNFKSLPWLPEDRRWTSLSENEKEIKLAQLISEKGKVSLEKAHSYVKGLSDDTKKFVFKSDNLPGYYFGPLVESVFHGIKHENRYRAEYAAECVIEMKKLLLKENPSAGIMVFFIPAAEKADPEFLSAFRDMSKGGGLPFGPLLEGKEYVLFCDMLKKEGIKVRNIADGFRGLPGTYSLDGHWSKKGIELATDYVSSKISEDLSL
jgi:hypothetical protein